MPEDDDRPEDDNIKPEDDTGNTGPGDDDGKGDDDKSGDDGKPDSDRDRGRDRDRGARTAIEAMKRERNAARRELTEVKNKLKEFTDKDKSESERLTEAKTDAESRASKAEFNYKRLQTAFERAPEHATPKQIMAVAKRIAGDSDEDMEADADELFDLLAPAKSSEEERRKPSTKPRESLKGGGDPDEEPEETDPRKLAALIGRP